MSKQLRFLQKYLPIVALGIFGLVWMVPLFWTLAAAFVPTTELLNGGPLVWLQNLHFGAFEQAWSVAPFARFYLNTIIWVFGLLAIQLVTISLAGFALARLDFRGKDQIFFLFLTQLMVPATVLILPNYQTLVTLGWLDSYQGMMAPYIASAFGTFLMRQAFKQVPKELEEAARSDGANWLQVLWHVFLPVTRAPLLAFSIVSITYHWNEFLWPLLITSSVEVRPLTVGLALLVQSSEIGAQWDQLSAGTLIVAVPILILIALVQKQFTNSFLSSGIK
ncbi:MAG: carbohydrate ABC transporter permease [Chloroflexota bacterium]|nr:carbohydrate ABC transporter permease [Chloroflexota bacterium]MYE27344.1 carbohydrate ABC transporter permease [Chloroflexota bacterium]